MQLRFERCAASAATAPLLNRRAFHGAVRTEYTAITGRGFEEGVTALALVEVDARIGRHGFDCCHRAPRTGKGRFENQLSLHGMVSNAPHKRRGPSCLSLVDYG